MQGRDGMETEDNAEIAMEYADKDGVKEKPKLPRSHNRYTTSQLILVGSEACTLTRALIVLKTQDRKH